MLGLRSDSAWENDPIEAPRGSVLELVPAIGETAKRRCCAHQLRGQSWAARMWLSSSITIREGRLCRPAATPSTGGGREGACPSR
jgi:hypothetical protein